MRRTIIALIVSAVFAISGVIILFFYDYKIELLNLEVSNVDLNNDYIEVIATKKNNIFFNHDYFCVASNGENEIKEKSKNGKCILKIPMNDDYNVVLKNGFSSTQKYELKNFAANDMIFNFEDDEILLVVGEEYKIRYKDKYIFKVDSNYEFTADKENIVSIENGVLKAISPGEVTISVAQSDSKLKVIVTNLITTPSYKGKRETIPCNRYSEEEAAMLDKLLEQRVAEAGFGTRAGAVAAARFLTIEFPYEIPYFYENGRISDSGVNMADGEGRYYHKGLYLSESKKNDISVSFSGPAIWGCPFLNWEEDRYFGYYPGRYKPNGLDCSGFVSWSLVNGGFDPGDNGAGETPDAYQMTDLGEFVPLTRDILRSGKIKVGDLFNYWGHISIIIGYDGTNYYVAESLPDFNGVDVRIYDEDGALDMFRYVVLMDNFYKEDGNYSAFWN